MMNSLLGIIPGGISVQDFSMVTQKNLGESKEILETFLDLGIGEKKNERFYFAEGDKLKIALMLIEKGLPLDEIAAAIGWKDFEALTGKILEEKNFAVVKNLILTKPRMEIDVIGIRLGVALLIDCKHWKRYSTSSMSEAIRKQIQRTKHYVSKTPGSLAVPVIVTLYQNKVDFIDRVPIVPIFQFSSFVDEFFGNLSEMKSIGTS